MRDIVRDRVATEYKTLHLDDIFHVTREIFTWSDNKVHELIMVKVLQTLLLNTPWSPSKYSPWEAMHRCQRLVHPSKQFWNWFCGMAFRAAIVLLLRSSMSSKCLPFNISFIFRNRKKVIGGLDPVNKQAVPTQLFV